MQYHISDLVMINLFKTVRESGGSSGIIVQKRSDQMAAILYYFQSRNDVT